MLSDGEAESSPPSTTQEPSVGIRFKHYTDVVHIPFKSTNHFYQLSYALWIKCESSCVKSNDPCYLVAKKGSFALGLRADEIAVAFHNKRPGWQWVGSRWRIAPKQWTHITVTYDSLYENAYIYANGRLVSTQMVKGKLKGSSQPLLVGVELKPAQEKGKRTRFKGIVSYLTWWEAVIDIETIHQHMSGDIKGTERNIIGHWPMKEGVGSTIFDHAEGKTHGTIHGAAWWMSASSVGQVDVPPSTLMEDMRRMFGSEIGSDIRLIAADGRGIHAHKIILATRSETFRALLFGGMKESHEHDVRFPDTSYEVLSLLIQFLYTDNADINGDIVVGLFMAADKYQLTRLRALCENFILQNISLDNVCTIFHTAHQLSALKLREFCFNWIINNFGDLLLSDSLTRLPIELQNEINRSASLMHFNPKKRKFAQSTATDVPTSPSNSGSAQSPSRPPSTTARGTP